MDPVHQHVLLQQFRNLQLLRGKEKSREGEDPEMKEEDKQNENSIARYFSPSPLLPIPSFIPFLLLSFATLLLHTDQSFAVLQKMKVQHVVSPLKLFILLSHSSLQYKM
jgi:hypothetical protein